MKIMQLSKRKGETGGAPRQTEIMGQPHMLAYINEAERQMLKRAGGAEAPGPEGIPAYWTLLNPSSWGDGNGYQGITSSSSTPSNSSNSTADAYKEMADSMSTAGVANVGGKVYPDEPFNSGNPPIMEYDGSNGQYTVAGGLDPNRQIEMATNEDGTYYQANNNPVNVQNTLATALGVQTGNTSGMVVNDGNGGYITTGGEEVDETYNPTGDGSSTTTTTTDTGGGGGGGDVAPVAPPVNQALLDARARRDAALAAQMGNLGSAFGFATDDYYTGLGTSYRDGGLSESFTTAYDDATRGIYDTFKSAGMLTQQGVDDSMGILAGAKGGEEGRINSIVDQYTNANRNYVTGGQDDITAELQALSSPSEDIGTLDAQTAQISGFDVNGRVLPYKTPEEQEVTDFFTDFVKRSYDPSYNVDPSAVASGGPKRVSNSVDKLGAGTQPSTIAGILDPVAGGSVRVVG